MDTSSYQLIKNIPAGFGATDLQMTPDGAYVFVNNSSAGSVTVIDTQSLTGTTTSLGGMPQGSVLVPGE
jgi:YVTN family beta-propeller protein